MIHGPVTGMVTPGWETVLTRVKTLTRVFEGREEPLLRDSNTFFDLKRALTT